MNRPHPQRLRLPRPVETIAITRRGGETHYLLGQIEAETTVRTQTDGLVQRVFSSIRRSRHPGTTIAILDDADQRLAVAEHKLGWHKNAVNWRV